MVSKPFHGDKITSREQFEHFTFVALVKNLSILHGTIVEKCEQQNTKHLEIKTNFCWEMLYRTCGSEK